MANPSFQAVVRARIEGMIAEAEAQKSLDHRLVKGRVREILLENLLKPLAPPSFFLGGGVVMDHLGQQSGEIDIVIANRSIVPHIGFGSRDGIFPVEAANYVFEIKSKLVNAHADEILEKFRAVHRLAPLAIGNIAEGQFRSVTALFAYSAANSLTGIFNKFTEANRSASAPVVQVVCIPGRGYWRWRAAEEWIKVEADANRSEILQFLTGITNTMFEFGGSGTKFGRYLG